MSPDDPVVETADMLDHMLAYKRADDTDEAGFHKKVKAAINALDAATIIKPIKGTGRYIIEPPRSFRTGGPSRIGRPGEENSCHARRGISRRSSVKKR
jgi:hypothetical protein